MTIPARVSLVTDMVGDRQELRIALNGTTDDVVFATIYYNSGHFHLVFNDEVRDSQPGKTEKIKNRLFQDLEAAGYAALAVAIEHVRHQERIEG